MADSTIPQSARVVTGEIVLDTDFTDRRRAFLRGRGNRLENLNEAIVEIDDGADPFAQGRKPVTVDSAAVELHFSDLESVLCREIEQWPVVVGCMAWLTNERVLKSLATRSAVSIIVQKEDFLRPDVGGWSKDRLRWLYKSVPDFTIYSTGFDYNICSGGEREGVRCAGIAGDRKNIPPRLHHKFLVFCSDERISDDETRYRPQAVWTGSFNATHNATRSIENAVLIRSPDAAQAYYNEWGWVLGLSEPLNWSSQYVEPEYRIGT